MTKIREIGRVKKREKETRSKKREREKVLQTSSTKEILKR